MNNLSARDQIIRGGSRPTTPGPETRHMIRTWIANSLIGMGRSIGQTLGLELAVEVNDHSIRTRMEKPDESEKAWDENLYRHGNLFVSGYANPIKPDVRHDPALENPNTVDVKEGDPDDESDDVDETDDGRHVELISSARYREYMRQDLISQLLTPESRWNLIVWAVIGLGVLQFVAIIVTLYATGSFS